MFHAFQNYSKYQFGYFSQYRTYATNARIYAQLTGTNSTILVPDSHSPVSKYTADDAVDYEGGDTLGAIVKAVGEPLAVGLSCLGPGC